MISSATGADSDWLRNLRPQFLAQTKDRLSEIKVHRQTVIDGGDHVAGMKAIVGIAHKISGTADTFGFIDLGVFARQVEAQFMTGTDSSDAPFVIWSRMEAALTSLIQEVESLVEPD